MKPGHKHIWTLLLFLLPAALHAETLPLYYEIAVDAGSTNNLFADSIGVEDSYGGIGLVLEQSLSPAFLLWYEGYGETFANTSGLASLDHTLAMESSTFIGQRGELWGALIGDMLFYDSEYELYNRRSGMISGGYRHLASQSLRLRAEGRYGATEFPNADTVDVDYREGSVSAGINAALRIPVSIDLEPGLQWRNYGGLENPTTTSYFWLSLRTSTPINNQTGLVMRFLLRDQLGVGGQEIYALARGGLDASDMLWDGWQTGVTINRMEGPWWFGGSLDIGHSTYAESVIYTDLPARSDDLKRVSFSMRRSLNSRPQQHPLLLELTVSYTSNESSIGYYTYDGLSARVGLRLSAD